MGVEPTLEQEAARATVLKTARPTGTRPPPDGEYKWAVHLAVARLVLYLAENGSLKGKRMVVKSVVQRVRNRFNVAVAEVATQDVWQMATLGIVCVSADPRHANEMVSKVVHFIESERLDAEVGDVEIELITV